MKLIPRTDGTRRNSEIVFLSPTGEEIRNKRQLGTYLKSHPEGPPASKFDWSTGETPRRSARISVKAKAIESSEELPRKRPKKSTSNDISDEKMETPDEEPEETQGLETELTANGTKQNVVDEKADDTQEIDESEKVADEIAVEKKSTNCKPSQEKIPGDGGSAEEPLKEHPELEDANKSVPAEAEPEGNLLVKEEHPTKDAEGAGCEVLDKDEKQNGDTENQIMKNKLGENAEGNKRGYSFDENVSGRDQEVLMAGLLEEEAETVKVSGANGVAGDVNNEETHSKNLDGASTAPSAPGL